MKDIDHMIAVMQAAKKGKEIQFRGRGNSSTDENWGRAPSPIWDWAAFEYRIKPTEPRRIWLNWYPTKKCRSSVCYDSREEAASFAIHDIAEQVEYVEVVK